MYRIPIIVATFLLLWTSQLNGGSSVPLPLQVEGSEFLYYYADPIVVYQGDESTPFKIEVATSGQNISQVRVFFPLESPMYDDGTHGDRLAGDGIHTLNDIPNSTQFAFAFGGTHVTRGHIGVVIERADESEEQHWLGIGLVSRDQHFSAVELGDGIYATQYALLIVDPSGSTLGEMDWPLGDIQCGKTYHGVFEKLYSVLPDVFDFVIVMPAHPVFDPGRSYAENVPYFVRAKNEIQNIGVPLFDNTAQFHSAGRLMGMIYHSWGYGSILDHEIGHAWAADLGRSLDLTWCADCYGNHWNPLSDIGGQMAAFLPHPDVLFGSGHLKDNGDGTWRIERTPADSDPYSPLELYVMGLIPPQEVPPVHLLINPDITDAQRVVPQAVSTYTIYDLMAAEGGERVPSWQTSQKQFNVAFVVVKDRQFSPADFTFYSLVSKYFASQETGEFSLTPFHEATGGRASLNAVLPVEIAAPTPPVGPWLESAAVAGFRTKVRISAGSSVITGRKEANCIEEALCVSGAVPGRPEVFVRVVGPKPNGFLWPTVVKFSTSQIEVWIEQSSRGEIRYYRLDAVTPGTQFLTLNGLADRLGFAPPAAASVAEVPSLLLQGGAPPEATSDDPPPPPGPWLTTGALPGFRTKVRFSSGSTVIAGTQVGDCISEALCVAGAVPGRAEVFVRVVGPKPNGFLWPTLVKFSTSQVEVWIEQTSSGRLRYYRLGAVTPGGQYLTLDGLADKMGF